MPTEALWPQPWLMPRPEDDVHVACAPQGDAEENFWDIPRDRLEKTFMVNIVGMISLAQKAIHHMQPGSSIINVGLPLPVLCNQ